MLTAVPLLSLLVFGNATFVPGGGGQANYWSTVVLPTALAMLPWTFMLVPQWRAIVTGESPNGGAGGKGRASKGRGKSSGKKR
jgi:hypothetical protein